MATSKQHARAPRSEKEIIRLEHLEEYGLLNGFVWPTERHDPSRDWALAYVEYAFPNPYQLPPAWGHVSLAKRASTRGGCFELAVSSEIADDFRYWQLIDATLTCRQDATATPVEWSVRSSMRTPSGGTVEESKLTQTSRVGDGTVDHTLNGVAVRNTFSGPLIEAHALYAVAMALPAQFAPLDFTLLDDLRMVKAGHRLQPGGTRSLTHAGETRTLRRLLHAGRGMFPEEYWLDETGHLLFSISDLGCRVLDPAAAKHARRLVESRPARRMNAPKKS